MRTAPAGRSGTTVIDSIDSSGTGSIQTVCQIPVTDVYQIPLGSLTCLPRAWVQVSVGSQTETASSCVARSPRSSVTSKLNGVYPPLWSPASSPFT